MTLLAPNNEAMEAATWPEDKVELEDLLKYHAVAQLVNSNDMTDEHVVNSIAGKIIRFNSYNDGSVSFEFLSLTTHGGLRKPVVAVVDPEAMMLIGSLYPDFGFPNGTFHNVIILICSSGCSPLINRKNYF